MEQPLFFLLPGLSLAKGTAVLFNDNLPHLAGTLQEALQEHAQQGLGGVWFGGIKELRARR